MTSPRQTRKDWISLGPPPAGPDTSALSRGQSGRVIYPNPVCHFSSNHMPLFHSPPTPSYSDNKVLGVEKHESHQTWRTGCQFSWWWSTFLGTDNLYMSHLCITTSLFESSLTFMEKMGSWDVCHLKAGNKGRRRLVAFASRILKRNIDSFFFL